MIKKKKNGWAGGGGQKHGCMLRWSLHNNRHSPFLFFFMMEWNPSGNPAGMQHAVVQKPLSVLRPPFPATSHPGGHWWTSGILGVLQCHWMSIFCHMRVLCASVFYASAALWLWGLGDRLYMSIMSFHVYHGDWSTSTKRFSLLPAHKHVDIHAAKGMHSGPCSHSLCISCSSIPVTFWRPCPLHPHHQQA